MPSLVDLRRRIRAVRNMQQITTAMKMISAARLRRAQDRVIAARPRVELELMGRKGRDFFRRRHAEISGEYATLFLRTVNYDDALKIARKVMQRFINAEIDAVYIIGNEFKSIATQQVTMTRLL